MPMAKQPFGTRRLPRVSRNERAVDPQTGKPEKPVEYNIVLPTDAGDKVIGFVQRVPYGGRGSRDHWRPWPASWAGPDLPDVITDDAAYIKAIEVLVEAWHASEPGTQMTPEAAAQAPPSPAEQAAAGGDLYDNPVQPTPRPAEPEYPPKPDPYIDVMADAHDAEFEPELAEPERSSADDYADQERERQVPEPDGSDLSGAAVLGGVTAEEAAAVVTEQAVTTEGPIPGHLVPLPGQERPAQVVEGIAVAGDVAGTAEADAMWEGSPPEDVPEPPPPPPSFPPPPAAASSDLSWLAAPAVPKDDDQEPPDPFSDPRVTPFA